MKFVEAMELGSMVVKPTPGLMMNAANQAGCALGMAAEAKGCTWGDPVPRLDNESDDDYLKRARTTNMELFWPWLAHSVAFPCDCYKHRSSDSDMAKVVIAHLFDEHVFGVKDWTRERFVEFLKSIEPSEFVGIYIDNYQGVVAGADE